MAHIDIEFGPTPFVVWFMGKRIAAHNNYDRAHRLCMVLNRTVPFTVNGHWSAAWL